MKSTRFFALSVAVAIVAQPACGYTQPQVAASSDTQIAADPGAVGTSSRPTVPWVDAAGKSYAQYLLDTMLAANPDVLDMDVHIAPPGTDRSTLVASKVAARIGYPSDPDTVAVSRSGEPRVKQNRRGDRTVSVTLPLLDIYRKAVGAVEFTFRPSSGTMDEEALTRTAAHYRDKMSRRILDGPTLLDPAQLNVAVPTLSYAQFLVEDALVRHPDVEVLALHARTARESGQYPIIASNIARFGKPADASDLAVVRTGAAVTAADERGARYEVKLPLQDASRATIGIVDVVFAYGSTSSAGSLKARAEKIVSELQLRIPDAAALTEPYPGTRLTPSAPVEQSAK